MYTFIETRLFSRLVDEYLSSDEYQQLQKVLTENPELGRVIKGSGGVRKVRWRAAGRGKRGGYRVIYFVRREKGVLWMLTIYPKNEVDSISGAVLNQIRQAIESNE